MPSKPKEPAALEIVYLPTERLHPNPWNPNQQNSAVAQALSESLDAYGHIAPVSVRAHPELPGEWQIIDGEHRWREAIRRNDPTVPCVVLNLDDAAARKLTIILNEVSGDADVALLGKLLLELQDLQGEGELLTALPYTDTELAHLLALGATDWDDFAGSLKQGDGGGLQTFALKLSESQIEEAGNYLTIIERELELDRGDALVVALREKASALHGGASTPE